MRFTDGEGWAGGFSEGFRMRNGERRFRFRKGSVLQAAAVKIIRLDRSTLRLRDACTQQLIGGERHRALPFDPTGKTEKALFQFMCFLQNCAGLKRPENHLFLKMGLRKEKTSCIMLKDDFV